MTSEISAFPLIFQYVNQVMLITILRSLGRMFFCSIMPFQIAVISVNCYIIIVITIEAAEIECV